MDVMQIKDEVTGEIHKVSPAGNTVWVTSRDGTRVRLHPTILKIMVPKGSTFSGHTITGERPMKRL